MNAIIESDEGKPKLNATKLETDLKKLDIKLKGGASWLYNIFISKNLKFFKLQIKKIFLNQILKK